MNNKCRGLRFRLFVFAVSSAAARAFVAAGVAAGFPVSVAFAQEQPDLSEGLPVRTGITIGRFSLRPRINIGAIGLDTNVFYTATDRRTDFTASGGPGLEVVLPIRGGLETAVEGDVGYVYFARTTSQRRLTGGGEARLAWQTPRTQAIVAHEYMRSFGRLGVEVDRRVVQDRQATRAAIAHRVGQRLHLSTAGRAERFEFDQDQDFLGADVRRNLSRDTYTFPATIRYALTPKTSLLLEGDHQMDRFQFAGARDADSNRIAGGFQIDSKVFFSGRAVGGMRFFRPREAGVAQRTEPYGVGELTYHFGPRTRLTATYSRDLAYSAFTVTGGTPLVDLDRYSLRLEKGLIGRFDLRLHGTYTELRTDGSITVPTADGPVTQDRSDHAREAGADLGYVFRSHIRVGLAATWVDRRSTFTDFGIDGLLAGATVTWVP